MSLREVLTGAVVMAPMTKGSNLPYRRLCLELGAQVLMSEMVVARRLNQRRQGEFALIRRAPNEPSDAEASVRARVGALVTRLSAPPSAPPISSGTAPR